MYLTKATKDYLISLAESKEKIPMKVMAGYLNDLGLVFSGVLESAEEKTDGSLIVKAYEGSKELGVEIINKNYSPGTKLKEIVKNIMANSSLGIGVINCEDYVFSRGYNAQNTIINELNSLAGVVGAVVFVNKSIIYFVERNYKELKTQISADNGLKSIEKNEDGVVLRMFLHNFMQEGMEINVKDRLGKETLYVINSVSHKFSNKKFETVLECGYIE